MTTATYPKPITAKQGEFLRTLLAEREMPTHTREALSADLPTMTARRASDIISDLLRLPRTVQTRATLENTWHATAEVPAGYYALETPGGEETDGEVPVVKFYRVDKPDTGKWAGYTFVKVQASDEFHTVRGQGRIKILAAIAADPEAGPRYGREIGRCWRCHRTLTDAASRAAGIGPDCASQV